MRHRHKIQVGKRINKIISLKHSNLTHKLLLFVLPVFLVLYGVDVKGQVYTSVQDGSWQTASTWDEPNDPGCTVNDDVVIKDTITCACDPLDIKGNGSITVDSGGYLEITSSTGLTGDGDLTVNDGGGLSVEGDLDIGGSGNFTVDGDAEVGGDMNVSGSGSANGDGNLDIAGSGCGDWEGSGDCEDGVNLPVELLSFEGRAREGYVELQWRTASELRCDHYVIERAREDSDFEAIDRVEGAGTTQELSQYRFEDQELPEGEDRLYYRLVQVDRDGEQEIYGPVAVKRRKADEEEIGIYPNPSKGQVFVELEGFKDQEVLVVVRDTEGKEHYSKVMITNEGGGHVEGIDLRDKLSSGLYLITATSNERIHQKKLMIE